MKRVTRRGALWTAFVLVQVLVATAGFLLPKEPMGDVYRVYLPWSTAALGGGPVVGIDEAWVYPQLALLPMLLAHLPGTLVGSYIVGWAIVVAAANAVAFAVLVGHARSRGRVTAAWFWLACTVLLGPVGMYRIDGLTVPFAIVGCLWLVRRPWLGAALLAVATWMKVWPAAVLAAAVLAVRRPFAVIGASLAVTAAVIGTIAASGGIRHVFGFIADQTGRGLQVEAVVSTPFVWGTLTGVPGFAVYYNRDLLTFEVTGADAFVVNAVMTPALVAVTAIVLVLGAVKTARGASFAALFPPLALALAAGFIVANKVGSPQFAAWLIAPVVVGLVIDRRRFIAPAGLMLGIALLTQLVYPVLYDGILTPQPLPVLLLTLRNAAYAVLLVWMVVRVARLRTPSTVDAIAP